MHKRLLDISFWEIALGLLPLGVPIFLRRLGVVVPTWVIAAGVGLGVLCLVLAALGITTPRLLLERLRKMVARATVHRGYFWYATMSRRQIESTIWRVRSARSILAAELKIIARVPTLVATTKDANGVNRRLRLLALFLRVSNIGARWYSRRARAICAVWSDGLEELVAGKPHVPPNHWFRAADFQDARVAIAVCKEGREQITEQLAQVNAQIAKSWQHDYTEALRATQGILETLAGILHTVEVSADLVLMSATETAQA